MQPAVPGGPHSPARRVTFAPQPMSPEGPYVRQRIAPHPFPSGQSNPAAPMPPHMQSPAAQPPSVAWSSRPAGAVPPAGNSMGYRPWVPTDMTAAPSQAAAALPGMTGLFPSPLRPAPPGFPQSRPEEARVQNHRDLEAAMRVFSAPGSPSAASAGASSLQLPHLPRPAMTPSHMLQPGALHASGAQQFPAGRYASAPAAPVGAQMPGPQQPMSDDYILGLLGISGGPKPASQQQQQQQHHASSVSQPSAVSQQDDVRSESEAASEYSDYDPPGAPPQAYWQRPGVPYFYNAIHTVSCI